MSSSRIGSPNDHGLKVVLGVALGLSHACKPKCQQSSWSVPCLSSALNGDLGQVHVEITELSVISRGLSMPAVNLSNLSQVTEKSAGQPVRATQPQKANCFERLSPLNCNKHHAQHACRLLRHASSFRQENACTGQIRASESCGASCW